MNEHEIIKQLKDAYAQIDSAQTTFYQDNLRIEIGNLLSNWYYKTPKDFEQLSHEVKALEELLNEKTIHNQLEKEFLVNYLKELKKRLYNLKIKIIRNWLENVEGQELNEIEKKGIENTIKILTQYITNIDGGSNNMNEQCIEDKAILEEIINEFSGRGLNMQNYNDLSSAEQIVCQTTKEYLLSIKEKRK